MINVICGFSGSGKTTYVLKSKKENDVIIDLDFLKSALKNYTNIIALKDLQLEIAKFFIMKKVDIWYITCYPNPLELELFKNIANFIWINTNLSKSLENVQNRNRFGDLSDIKKISKFNYLIAKKYYASDIKFKIIDVFESNERW